MAGDLELNLGDLDARFTDPDAAAVYLEGIRWPNGTACPHCGEADRVNRLNSKATTRRLWKCYGCRKQFTVTVGTIFESSHIPLNKWLLAFYLLCASKKGMSAHQLHRMLGVTYKTAWFMFHRIREAMRDPAFASRLTGTVEADETYIGGRRKGMVGRPGPKDKNKRAVMTLVVRDGQAHGQGEYVRGAVHTNTVEGYFATLKRGVNGVYHHVSPAHLHRYLNEFDFRYNTRHLSDGARTVAALGWADGKRLMYADSR